MPLLLPATFWSVVRDRASEAVHGCVVEAWFSDRGAGRVRRCANWWGWSGSQIGPSANLGTIDHLLAHETDPRGFNLYAARECGSVH
jgi:hypothetical protein